MSFSRDRLIERLEAMDEELLTAWSSEMFCLQFQSYQSGMLALNFAVREGLLSYDPDTQLIRLPDELTDEQIRSAVLGSIQYEVSWYEV